MKNGEPDAAKRLMSNSYVLYKMKNSPVQWDGKQFSYLIKPIGAAAAYSIVSDLKEMGVNVMESYTQSDAFKILIKGRLDGVADLETMADLILKGNPEEFKDVVKVSPPIRTKEYYLMFSHRFAEKLPKVMNDIWNELQRVRESGEYDKIAEKYAEMPK
jgi:polar amino acid transport system substrate-binding protein